MDDSEKCSDTSPFGRLLFLAVMSATGVWLSCGSLEASDAARMAVQEQLGEGVPSEEKPEARGSSGRCFANRICVRKDLGA